MLRYVYFSDDTVATNTLHQEISQLGGKIHHLDAVII